MYLQSVLANTIKQSQAVQVGPHIFVSGQIPADKNGNLVEGSIADKTKASCEGMKAILEEAGSSMSKVIKVCYCHCSGVLSLFPFLY
jgi:enamine deaminase RidA (YjgF/YER057c/UK114 family)